MINVSKNNNGNLQINITFTKDGIFKDNKEKSQISKIYYDIKSSRNDNNTSDSYI
jgi:hypothetical protein